MLLGWYDPYLTDPQGLRATEVKGLWRYWARAVLAGVLYDKGMLSGQELPEINKCVREEESRAISCLVGKILGLGYVGKSEAESSRFRIRIRTKESRIIKATADVIKKFERINLLSLSTKQEKRELTYINKGAKFEIEVVKERSAYEIAEDLAMKILVLALQLCGIGKGSRRGLGSIDIEEIQGLSIEKNKLGEFVETIYKEANQVVDLYIGDCPRLEPASMPPQGLPPIPVLSKTSFPVGDDQINVSNIHIISDMSFEDAHNFFLRSYRCKRLTKNKNPKCFDAIRNSNVGWFLGLPRSQKKKSTGYLSKIDRRASPLLISYHEDKNVFGPGVYLTTLLSGDWPRNIEWRGEIEGTIKSSKITVTSNEVIRAYKIVIKEFQEYARICESRMVKVWPK